MTGWGNSCELRRWAGLLVALLSVLLFCPTAQAATPATGALGALQQTASQTVAATVGAVAQQTDATLHQVAAPVQQLRQPVQAVGQQVDQVVHDVAAPVVSAAVEGAGSPLPTVSHPVKRVEEAVHAAADDAVDPADLGSAQSPSTGSGRTSERGTPVSTEQQLAGPSSSSTRASHGAPAGGGHGHAAASLGAPTTAANAPLSAASDSGWPAQQTAPAEHASDNSPAPVHEPSPSPAPRPGAGGGGASSVSLLFGGAAVLLAALALCAGGPTRRLSSTAGRWYAVPFVSALERPD